MKEDKNRYKSKAARYEQKIRELHQVLETARARSEKMASENDELRARVDTLQEESARRVEEVRRLREDGATIPEEEVAELKRENTKYIQEIERAKRVSLSPSLR